MKPYIFDKRLRHWGLFLSDLPDVNWVEYVRYLQSVEAAAKEFNEHVELNGGCHKGCPEHDALQTTLAGGAP